MWKCWKSNCYSKCRGAFSASNRGGWTGGFFKGRGTVKHFTKTGSDVSEARSGRTKMSTSSEHQCVKFSSLRDRRTTSSQIQNFLNKEHKTPISKSTVKRKLSCHGLSHLTSAQTSQSSVSTVLWEVLSELFHMHVWHLITLSQLFWIWNSAVNMGSFFF